MNADPKGYYALLGVVPGVAAEAITAAFRRRARVVHPDVPGTGDAASFVALKAAYDVLADPSRRAAYDGSGRSNPLIARQPAQRAAPPPRFRRVDLPMVVWAAVLGLPAIVAVALMLQLASPELASPELASPGDRPPLPRPRAAVSPLRAPARPPVRLAGNPTHYVAPGSGPAPLWRPDATDRRLLPAGRIAPFTGVHALGLVPEHGLMAVALEGGGIGFVDAARLLPGDAADARQAFCADQAGPPPANAELLARRGAGGTARLVIRNRGEQPAVIKLRDQAGRTEASLFVAPRMNVTVVGLPGGPWQADVAIGELWSRACGLFAAGMRAQRLGVVEPGSELIVPPQLAATDIPDQAFVRD